MENFSTVVWVVAVALIDSDDRVLMQRRRAGAEHGGLWEFPGGKVDPGESPEAAAIREIEEELGVLIDPAALMPVAFASDGCLSGNAGVDRPRAVVILLYSCRHWTGEPRCLDADAIAWIAADRIAALEMPPLDYPLADALQKLHFLACQPEQPPLEAASPGARSSAG